MFFPGSSTALPIYNSTPSSSLSLEFSQIFSYHPLPLCIYTLFLNSFPIINYLSAIIPMFSIVAQKNLGCDFSTGQNPSAP